MAKRASFFGFLIVVMCGTSASADAYLVKNGGGILAYNTIEIAITGQITQQDFAFFSSRSKDFEFVTPYVYLNSRGGDVDAAMKIGRIIRSVDGYTEITEKCYSSCALIFIAGVKRFNRGELGLHRPYFAAAPLSREQIEKQMPVMRSAVKKYVEEMGITESFFERMFNTDPSAIEIYRGFGDESEKIVPTTDPTYDEISTSQSAQMYGVTTSEYRKREALAESCITITRNFDIKTKYPDCHDSIMWGLSPEVYRSRSAVIKTRCGTFSDSEGQLLRATPRKDQRSLPFVVQYYACQLSTMSGN